MNNFTKKFTSIALSVVFSGMFLVLPVFADEADNLVVEFETMPLFSETNFLPGESVIKWVKVANNSGQLRDIAVEAINVSDSDNLGDAINIQINEGGSELFNGSFSDFFNAGEIPLSSVASGSDTQYDFIVDFSEIVGDSYQERSLGFDILIGFKGDGGSTFNSGGEGGGGGFGGGGGGGSSLPPGLSILDETVTVVSVTETTAIIVWSTSYKSTSRVVYDTASGYFDLYNLPNYGYSFSTPEFNSAVPISVNGVTFHSVTITGLTSGATYYYRAISHASPDSISREYYFKTLGVLVGEEIGKINKGAEGGSGDAENVGEGDKASAEVAVNVRDFGQGSGLIAEAGRRDGGSFDEERLALGKSGELSMERLDGVLPPEEENGEADSIFGNLFAASIFGIPFSFRWIFIIAVIIIIVWILIRRRFLEKRT